MAKNTDIEYRYLEPDVTECRALEEENKRFLEGHASVFSQKSKLIFENERIFNEIIAPNAFDDLLKDEKIDVPMTFNHERGRLLGRTKSNTLQISKDEKGLRFRVEIPNTTTGNDVYELVKRGDLYENSFGFISDRSTDTWTKDENGTNIRTVNNIKRLVDISIVTSGAYANTDVAARSFEEHPEDVEVTERLEPEPGESEDEYISECVKYVMDEGETDDNKQAYAICKSKWDNRSAKVNQELTQMRMHITELKLKIK